ncbi:MAG: response regulator [Legionellaceae bacterium]|nr:response regulator [Legionellaceae bacterium]
MNENSIILLAEDDDFDSELTMEALKEYSVENKVERVCDGEELLEFLRCEGKHAKRKDVLPAVLLLDLKMPKLDGIEALRIIKSDDRFKLVPVVVLTSSHEDKDLQTCYALNVNAYVVKPVDFHQLVDAVKEIGCFWSVYNKMPYTGA